MVEARRCTAKGCTAQFSGSCSPCSRRHSPPGSSGAWPVRRPRAPGFTLIELLVVVGIVALLAAILLPSLSRARGLARDSVCKSHQRQIGMAITMYTSQNDEVFPTYRWYDPGPDLALDFGEEQIWINRPRWNLVISPYIEETVDTRILDPDGDGIANVNDDDVPFINRVFVCPDSPEQNTSRNASYGYNYQYLGHARVARLTSPPPVAGPPWINYPVTMSRIGSSARTLMVADSMGTAAGYARNERQPFAGAAKLCNARGNHAYNLDPPVPWYMTADGLFRLGNVGEMSCEPGGSAPHARAGYIGVDPRHHERANAVFVDGHVEGQRPRDLGYVVRGDGSFAYNALGELFTDLNGNGIPDRKDEWVATNELFTGAGIHKPLPPQPGYR